MYQVTKTYTRPSIDVDFYSIHGDDIDSITFRSHWTKTYKETGKLVILTEELSNDELSKTIMAIWASKEDCYEAYNDTTIINMINIINTHNNLHGISVTKTEVEVDISI
jgi:hypothetical protein